VATPNTTGFPVEAEESMSSENELLEELARLRAENEELRTTGSQAPRGLSFRVSEKGAVSVYGLGRFPVTLYQEQWEKLLAQIDDLKAFIEANRNRLKKKTP
jgi:ABC-type uncharacterized transport system YnjBCD substrate-binding protein